jgi:class 3 adenylate cyclase/DNA-binding winged helix-turn-helix (wHTH) protein/predicted ATPase
MSRVADKIFCFEGYTLDLRRGCLRGDDREVELRPKSFEVLRYLVENAGRLVSKDELIGAVWPDVIVTDDSLTRCVSDVRLALQDHGQRIIKTVPRRGYLLAAPVSQSATAAGMPSSMAAAPMVTTPGGNILAETRSSASSRYESAIDRRERDQARPAERRQLTVMACELTGLATLSTQLDPEDLREMLSMCRRRCTEIVEQHRGNVAQYSGDSLLAYFGYPSAQEHDAESAVLAGLALVGSAVQLSVGLSSRLQFRIGIASGLVVIGDELAAGEAKERIAVGGTPSLAGRLRAVARAGSLIIDESTRRLVGELFTCRDLRPVALDGFAQPVPACEVLGVSTVESRFEAHHRGFTPLVGREEELELLMRRWRQAASGEGRVVLISGEPGIGKSRLTVALEERLKSEPHSRLRYFCSPHHTDSALYPTIRQLERAARSERHDGREAKLDKLSSLLGASSKHETDTQLLAELLSIPTGNRYAPLNWSPQRKKEQTFEALLSCLRDLSRRRPVFAVYEDVHWADPSSRELLDITVERAASLPVLLVITFRPEFQPPWIGQAHVTPLILSRLSRRSATALVAQVAKNDALPADIVTEIVDRTDGVPLFVEEMTKAVLEAATNDGEGGATASMESYSALAVPATLHALLMSRLDRLGPVSREIAQVGAAIGREFSYELIAAVADHNDSALRAALDQLVDAGLVFRRGSLPEATFLFKHALVQDAAHGTLLKSDRQHMHSRIAQVLEERLPDHASAHPELVARHYAQAGLADKAIEYWDKAGRLAVDRSTMAEAAVHFGKALQLLAGLPKSPQRRSSELSLQLALARTLNAAKGWASPEAGKAYARARELCREVPEGQQLMTALYGVRSFLLNHAEFAAAHQVAEELLAVAGRQDDSDAKLMAHHGYGVSLLFRAEFSGALRHFREALAAEDRPGHGALPFAIIDPSVACRSFIPWTLLLQGYPDRALASSRQPVADARKVTCLYTLAYALHVNCVFHQLRGDGAMLRERAEELVTLATEQGFPHLVGSGTCFAGWATLEEGGSIEEAIGRMRWGLAKKRATGAEIKVPYYLGLLAETHRRAKRTVDAIRLLREALELVERTDERWYEAELYRLLAEALITNSDPHHAERYLWRALRTARGQGARLWELRATTGMARLWRDQGKRTEARNLLTPIYRWFTEGFDTRDLKEADMLLAELNGVLRPGASMSG